MLKASPLTEFHPRDELPPLRLDTPEVSTARGSFPAARAICYDDERLLFHHATCGPHDPPIQEFDELFLAHASSTAERLLRIARRAPWTQIRPLIWHQPNIITFTTCSDDGLFFDLAILEGWLTQNETLIYLPPLAESSPHTSALVYQRC